MKTWTVTFSNGDTEIHRATDIRMLLMLLPDGTPVLSKGHPDDVVSVNLVEKKDS